MPVINGPSWTATLSHNFSPFYPVHIPSCPDPAQETPEVEKESPRELFGRDADEASLWSSGDRKGSPPILWGTASKDDSIFHMSSNQALKVKAFNVFSAGRVNSRSRLPHLWAVIDTFFSKLLRESRAGWTVYTL